MADSAPRPPWLEIVLVAFPVIVPLVASILVQRGEARRASELEALGRRLELVEKLRTLRLVLPKDVADPLFREVDDIIGDLEAIRLREVTAIAHSDRPRSRLASLLLLYPQASRKGGIYRAIFYLFVGLGVVGLLGGMLEWSSTKSEDHRALVLGAFIYFLVGLAFRAAAVRDYTHHSEKQRLGEAHADAAV